MNRSDNLIQLGRIYKTDKVDHGYFDLYGQYLPEKCKGLLEIGVAKGASLQVWNAFYGTDCDIHCIDLFGDADHVSERWCRRNEFVPHQGDQSDTNFLYTIKNTFDVIIDDGSHRADHQQVSFTHLFLNNLRSGGLYVIEDLHCCKDPFYWVPPVVSFEDTMLYMLLAYVNRKTVPLTPFNTAVFKIISELVAKIIVSPDEKIVFIWRK